PRLIATAKKAMDEHGFGMASVRFICGTQDIHRALERELADFLGLEASILFSSCFDANGGVFEALLGAEDAVISDALNHASIIDGIRLCKARRLRYANNDMAELEARLGEAQDARHRLIVTDGVFSMDGIVADLPGICDLAEKYDALVMVDDSHATGFMGPHGGGTPDHWGLRDRVDLISTTFGKALGGASGGCVAGPAPLIEMLRNKARPYLFSNALAPAIVEATREALRMIGEGGDLRERLEANAARFRSAMTGAGFTLAGADHPIIPVMLGDAVLAQDIAARMMEHHVYVTAFSFPVVPRGQARIRTQMSAAHSAQDIDQAIEAFIAVGRVLEVIK
ncbi:MAG: glycine C-acetyltransferase, partial [Paracoccaceae bacterium]|nr:glycine C-acetyltransferase [Paracoccaceae bacterium]